MQYPQAKVSNDVYMLPPEKFICDAKGLKLDTQDVDVLEIDDDLHELINERIGV